MRGLVRIQTNDINGVQVQLTEPGSDLVLLTPLPKRVIPENYTPPQKTHIVESQSLQKFGTIF